MIPSALADDDRWRALVDAEIGPAGAGRAVAVVDDVAVARYLDVVKGPDRRPRVPPAMLPVWTMPGHDATADGTRWGGAGAELAQLRELSGATGVLAVEVDQRYERELLVGDRVSCRQALASVSAVKQTAVGAGRFLTFREHFHDADGTLLGTQRMTLLCYRGDPSVPRRAARPPDPGPSTPPEVERALTVDVTRALTVEGARATRDFEPVHHDREHAVSAGLPDVIVNVLTHAGFCVRLAEEACPDARVRSLTFRPTLPAAPGDRLRYELGATGPSGGRRLAVRGPRGAHGSGDVAVDA